jgi:phytanoyl-CoA dioxygenase PhyH
LILSASQHAAFWQSGFLLVADLVSAAALDDLCVEADRLLRESAGRGGVRNVLLKSSLLRELATRGAPARAARALLGDDAKPTKLTVFDKTPRANWKVPWHQDLTIAVSGRRHLDGFGPWTMKEGVVHVQPPVSLLEHVLAVRLHLDETPAGNGALRVLPGTHRLGRLSDAQIAVLRQQVQEEVCPVAAGGGMLMSPLLLHASSAAEIPSRRRVLHFEYSATTLPGGLSWA